MARLTSRLIVSLLVLASLPGLIPAADGPIASRAELAVLDRFTGEWTGAIEGGDSRMKLTHHWILGGHVLETRLTLDDSYEAVMHRTFDRDAGKYVMSYHDNSGSVLHLTGLWDASQKALVMEGVRTEGDVTLTMTFVDEDTLQWTLVQKSADTGSTIRGTHRRVKD
jgi:hypothetical protein